MGGGKRAGARRSFPAFRLGSSFATRPYFQLRQRPSVSEQLQRPLEASCTCARQTGKCVMTSEGPPTPSYTHTHKHSRSGGPVEMLWRSPGYKLIMRDNEHSAGAGVETEPFRTLQNPSECSGIIYLNTFTPSLSEFGDSNLH